MQEASLIGNDRMLTWVGRANRKMIGQEVLVISLFSLLFVGALAVSAFREHVSWILRAFFCFVSLIVISVSARIVRNLLWHFRAEYRIEAGTLVAIHPNGEMRRPTVEQVPLMDVEKKGGCFCVYWKLPEQLSKTKTPGDGFLYVQDSKEFRAALIAAYPFLKWSLYR
jgi:hypothetical protein